MWPDGILSRGVAARPVADIASLAGITLPDGCRFILTEESGFGPDHPFSGEKRSLVLTCYRF